MRRKRIKWWLAFVFFVSAGVLIYLNIKVTPLIKELAKASVSNKASSIINDAIEKQLEEGEINYDRIVFLEKDIQGNITALKTNIAEINRLKTQTLSIVDHMLLDLDISQVGLPIGSLIIPELFSGTGPVVPVRVVSISNSEADFRNVFSEAGINQTTHQIMLDVSIIMTVLTPAGTQNVEASSSVVVAETVIVGNVPGSYVDLN